MADKRSPGDPKKPLQEESIVARLKGGSGETPGGLTAYTGLLGRSSKEGYWLLYPSLDMGTSLEIQESDIVHSEALSPEQSPFGGLGGTRVFVRKGAQVTASRTITHTSQAGAGDEFDLDIRVGEPESGFPSPDQELLAVTGITCPNTTCVTVGFCTRCAVCTRPRSCAGPRC